VKRFLWIVMVLLSWPSPGSAQGLLLFSKLNLEKVNSRLHGHIVDFTQNHGKDLRIWSEALKQKRDLYVYLPPHFDPHRCYPLLLWLHGFAQDELSFVKDVICPVDQAIAQGQLPPMIVAAPDGSLDGHGKITLPGSFYMNTKAGAFEDHLMGEVWPFLLSHFPILPEREAHLIAGVSMGGNAAFNKAIKHRELFSAVAGIFPPLNVRWEDCHGRYQAKFDPCCWGWRTDFHNRREKIAQYGIFVVRQGHVVFPLFGKHIGPETVEAISRENPIEMLDLYDVREGQLCMYIGYCGKDEFNIDAQVESFLYRCRERCLKPEVVFYPEGHHDLKSAVYFFPSILAWIERQLARYKDCPLRIETVPVLPQPR
jgi:S-formylglutathione hydrolase FrmB